MALFTRGNATTPGDLSQAQGSTGTVLAKIDGAGHLAVKNAAVQGTLTVTGASTFNASITVNGHVITGNSSGTTVAAAAADAGTGATVTIAGNDTSGTVTITTGTGAASGVLATVTFANAFGATPRVSLTPQGLGSASVQYAVGSNPLQLYRRRQFSHERNHLHIRLPRRTIVVGTGD